MAKLADQLKMSRPFAVREEEASLAILRTADILSARATAVLRRFDMTGAQYNVLRILRGSPDGLGCSQISERLIAQDPDVTRLLDRMEARNWIARERSICDRRVVLAQLTGAGAELLEQVTPFVIAHHQGQFKGWSESQLKQLINLLEIVRETEPNERQESK